MKGEPIPDAPPDWISLFKKCMEELHWSPVVTRKTWPQFWYVLAGGSGGEKVHATTFAELQVHIDKYLQEQTPEGRLRKAEETLEHEMTWYNFEE